MYGQIEHFLCISVDDSDFVYAYITHFEKQDSNNRTHFHLPHSALDYNLARIVPVCAGNQMLITCYVSVCMLMCRNSYVCIPPNTFSVD